MGEQLAVHPTFGDLHHTQVLSDLSARKEELDSTAHRTLIPATKQLS